MALYVRSGTWKVPTALYVRSGGLWLSVQQAYVRTGGDWAIVANGGGGSVPVTPPSNVSRYTYAGSKIGLTWTTGEPTAQTRIYRRPNVGSAWTLIQTVAAGVTDSPTGYTSGQFAVAHLLGTSESALVTES